MPNFIAFIPEKLQRIIQHKIIDPLKKADPEQYFYPSKSLHLTIQNIRTINKPPMFTEDDIEKAKDVFSRTVPAFSCLNYKIKHLFELPTSLGIRAYAEEPLKNLCTSLRQELTKSGVSDDKTYASDDVFFGNISISRFTKKPNKDFFKEIENLKNTKVGELSIKSVHLVTTNSVCHPKKTKILGEYHLN